MALGTSYISSGVNTAWNTASDWASSGWNTTTDWGTSAADTVSDWTWGESQTETANENVVEGFNDFSSDSENTYETIIDEGVGTESLELENNQEEATVFDEPTESTGFFGSGGTWSEGYIEEGLENANQFIEPARDFGEVVLETFLTGSSGGGVPPGKKQANRQADEDSRGGSQQLQKKQRALNRKQRKLQQIKQKLRQNLSQRKREKLLEKQRKLKNQERQLKQELSGSGGAAPGRSRGSAGGMGTGTMVSLLAGGLGFLMFVIPDEKGSN